MKNSALSHYAEIVMGQSPPGEACNTAGRGLPLLNGPTEYGPHHPTPVQFTTDAHKRARPGDILFCVRGSTTGRMNWADREYAIGRGVAAIRHKKRTELQPFVRAVIEHGLPGLLAQATGSTFPNVSATQLAGLWWPSLDEDEQRAIAHILGTLDDKIELNRRMNTTLEAIARALFKSWFVDFDPVRAKAEGRDPGLAKQIANLFPDSFEDSELGEIPKGWEVTSVGDEVRLVKGVSYRSEHLAPSDTALVTLKSVNRGGGYRSDGLKQYTGEYKTEQVLSPRELVVAQTDVTQAAEVVGKPALVIPDERFQVLVASLDLLIVRPISEDLRQAYFYLMFQTPTFQDHVYGHTNGTTVLHLSKEGVPSFRFARPQERVARAFTSIVDALFDRVIQNNIESRTLAALRDALLPKLISGELRVKDKAHFIRKADL